MYSFEDSGSDLLRQNDMEVDFNWMESHLYGINHGKDPGRHAPLGGVDAALGLPLQRKVKNSCERAVADARAAADNRAFADERLGAGFEDSTSSASRTKTAEIQHITNTGEKVCSSSHNQSNRDIHVTSGSAIWRRGVKRKIESHPHFIVPAKRISPFLNTPSERKEERKRIIKMSFKKLKQLEDPESFLRRTVLVNNTVKRLQTEMRAEKTCRTSSNQLCLRKSKSGHSLGVLSNECLSNTYLFDDPFLCGVQEKITDDMTDTLVRNVLNIGTSECVSDHERNVEPDALVRNVLDIGTNECVSDHESNAEPDALVRNVQNIGANECVSDHERNLEPETLENVECKGDPHEQEGNVIEEHRVNNHHNLNPQTVEVCSANVNEFWGFCESHVSSQVLPERNNVRSYYSSDKNDCQHYSKRQSVTSSCENSTCVGNKTFLQCTKPTCHLRKDVCVDNAKSANTEFKKTADTPLLDIHTTLDQKTYVHSVNSLFDSLDFVPDLSMAAVV